VKEQRAVQLRDMEDVILKEALTIVQDGLRFREIDPTDEKKAIPEHMLLEHADDPEEAKRLHRVALANWMPSKDAPVGLKLATQVALGIVKARSVERAGPQSLNVQFIQMSTPEVATRQFEEIIIREEDG
jgi:hypothetical protein